MAYDVDSLKTELKTRGKDTSLPDSLLTTWLQEAQDSVLGHYRFPKLETSTTETLDIDDLTYAYPADLQLILGLKLKDGIQVYEPELMSYQEFDERYKQPEDATAGAPANAMDFGRQLYWSCPLDKAYDIWLKYLRQPVRFTAGNIVPDIPEEFRELMIRGGLQRIEEFRENWDIAAIHGRRVEDLTEDMVGRYNLRQLVTPHRATTGGKRVGKIRRR